MNEISLFIILALAVLWLVSDRRIEDKLDENE